jgi:hypothetical protein
VELTKEPNYPTRPTEDPNYICGAVDQRRCCEMLLLLEAARIVLLPQTSPLVPKETDVHSFRLTCLPRSESGLLRLSTSSGGCCCAARRCCEMRLLLLLETASIVVVPPTSPLVREETDVAQLACLVPRAGCCGCRQAAAAAAAAAPRAAVYKLPACWRQSLTRGFAAVRVC